MYTTRIEVYAYSCDRDDYNERAENLVMVGVFYAQRTENGGRENLYASRIVHEQEIVFTIRYTDKIRAGMLVKCEMNTMKITSVHEEGRRKYLHLKTLRTDVEG